MSDQQDERWQSWCILELLGHVRTAGLVSEEERFGTKLGRIDVPGPCKKCEVCGGLGKVVTGGDMPSCPECKGHGHLPAYTTQYFSGGSIYRLTPCDEATARRVAAANRPAPVHPWQFPALPQATSESTSHDDFHDEEDEDDEGIPY